MGTRDWYLMHYSNPFVTGGQKHTHTLPDFTTRKSDDDSVASGDDSADWEMEEDRVLNAFLAQTEAEDTLDDLSVDVPMKEVHEFMLISGEGEDGTEGHADGAAEVAPIAVKYKARQLCFIQRT